MDIITIFRREMVAMSRQGRQQGERAGLAILVFLAVGGSFAGWLYWFGGRLEGRQMIQVAGMAMWFTAFGQLGLGFPVLFRVALSIVGERERRTLDHLLVTRMSSAGFVLGKLASGILGALTTLAAGLPIVLLVHSLGGIDLLWIGLSYAELLSIVVFLGALAVWISVESPDRRSSAMLFTLAMSAWMIGPFLLATSAPKLAFRLPSWLLAANWWLASTSPLPVALHIITGVSSRAQLTREIGWMIAIQLGAALVLTLAAIARLRPVHRSLAGFDRKAARRARRRLSWRWLPRPPVGDDPIFWRERYTARDAPFVRMVTQGTFVGLSILLAVGTFVYARPAFAEVWQNGYASATVDAMSESPPVLIRLFGIRGNAVGPSDRSRVEFNLFIRYTTVPMTLILCFVLAGFSSEALGVERSRGTWIGLLSTPLTARDLIRSAMRAGFWRSRFGLVAPVSLWTLGLAAGAVHPIGFVVSIVELASASWMMATMAVLGSIRAPRDETAPDFGVAPTLFLTCTGLIVIFLPAGLNPVLIGFTSLPLIAWTSLVSWSEMAGATSHLLDTRYPWGGFAEGQMPLVVFTAWVAAIVGPLAIGMWARRYAVAHFDRLVGRPFRAESEGAPVDVSPDPPADISHLDAGPVRSGIALVDRGDSAIR